MDKKIIWLTDLHLNFVKDESVEYFLKSVEDEHADAVLIGGDTAEAKSITVYLRMIEEAVKAPVYFVLGNHDYYGSTIEEVREKVRARTSEMLVFLHDVPYVQLDKETALIGHGGWADSRLGDYSNSPIVLNDYVLIRDFLGRNKREVQAKLKELGDEAAQKLKDSIEQALERYDHIICLTHVPPYKESCWHEGRISGDHYLPHFASKATGDVLKNAMKEHPEKHLTVLCGHTHGKGEAKILPNLEVITGGAEYGSPKIQRW